MLKNFLYKSVVVSSFMFILSVATNASATPINTTAEVVGNITVSEVTPLNFGQFTVGTGGGLITYNAAGVISAGGDVILLGGEVGGVAGLDTTGAGVGPVVTVNVTGTTLTSGVNTMALVGNCFGPGGVLGVDNGACTFNSNGIVSDNVQIGGKLTVVGNQPSGIYTGTLEVTAAF
jgi:uncharacterized protein DUF4402